MVYKRGGGVKKGQNLVHIVCECPLALRELLNTNNIIYN